MERVTHVHIILTYERYTALVTTYHLPRQIYQKYAILTSTRQFNQRHLWFNPSNLVNINIKTNRYVNLCCFTITTLNFQQDMGVGGVLAIFGSALMM